MKNVTVLIDNEKRQSNFLKNFGMSIPDRRMCAIQTPTKIFLFQVFGLMITDSKLEKYVNQRDGLVILIDLSLPDQIPVLNRMVEVTKTSSKNLPILIVIENYTASAGYDAQIQWLQKYMNKDNVKLIILHNNNIDNDTDDVGDGTYQRTWFNNQVEKYQSLLPTITSINIAKDEMIKQFENATLDLKLWDHYGRLRIVYISLANLGFDKTVDPNGWLCTNWKKYKTTIGHQHLWNYSLTRFWTRIIYDLMKRKKYTDFAQLYNENYERMHNGNLHSFYYSPEVIFSEKAKNSWVPPTSW